MGPGRLLCAVSGSVDGGLRKDIRRKSVVHPGSVRARYLGHHRERIAYLRDYELVKKETLAPLTAIRGVKILNAPPPPAPLNRQCPAGSTTSSADKSASMPATLRWPNKKLQRFQRVRDFQQAQGEAAFESCLPQSASLKMRLRQFCFQNPPGFKFCGQCTFRLEPRPGFTPPGFQVAPTRKCLAFCNAPAYRLTSIGS